MSEIPDYTMQSMEAYVNTGQPPGGFLTAVFSNQFMSAVLSADSDNAQALGAIAMWIWKEAPALCWGSKHAVEAWIAQGGTNANR